MNNYCGKMERNCQYYWEDKSTPDGVILPHCNNPDPGCIYEKCELCGRLVERGVICEGCRDVHTESELMDMGF